MASYGIRSTQACKWYTDIHVSKTQIHAYRKSKNCKKKKNLEISVLDYCVISQLAMLKH